MRYGLCGARKSLGERVVCERCRGEKGKPLVWTETEGFGFECPKKLPPTLPEINAEITEAEESIRDHENGSLVSSPQWAETARGLVEASRKTLFFCAESISLVNALEEIEKNQLSIEFFGSQYHVLQPRRFGAPVILSRSYRLATAILEAVEVLRG